MPAINRSGSVVGDLDGGCCATSPAVANHIFTTGLSKSGRCCRQPEAQYGRQAKDF